MRATRNSLDPRISPLPKTRDTQMPSLPKVKPSLPPPMKSPRVMPSPVPPMPVPQAMGPSPNDVSQGKLQKGGFVPNGGGFGG